MIRHQISLESALASAFFPVELCDLSCDVSGHPDSRIAVPRHRAVVDLDRKEILSVVTTGYRLVKNEEAMAAGRRVFAAVFAGAVARPEDSMLVYRVDLSARRTTLHVDLLHDSFDFTVFEQEVWRPYLRVTNSYNKRHALRFDLGFVREACKNGMIFTKATIHYKRPHTLKDIAATIEIPVVPGWLQQMIEDFTSHMKNLHAIAVARPLAQPIMARALDLSFDDLDSPADSRRKAAEKKRRWFKSLAPDLLDHYTEEFGGLSAYTVLNAASEFATRPPPDGPVNVTSHGLQLAVGAWAERFGVDARRRDFSMDRYAGALRDQLSLIGAPRA